jgi:hypothetical protein
MQRRILEIAGGVLLVSLVLTGHAAAQDSPARMDKIVQSYVDAQQFMGSVLVARGDKVLFSKGYGSANLEWNIPNTPTTKFRLGSVTKQFTAAAILLLEERGKLKVEDPVKKHYPDAPAAWDKITLFHLLTHTSGIPNYTYPDDKVTVVALSNLNGPGPDAIVEKLGALVHGQAVVLPSERVEIKVPMDVLKKYVGTYTITPEINVMITFDGDHLVSQMSGQGKLPLFAQSETSFFMRAVEVQLDFVKDASGSVTHLVSHQGGRDTTAKRVSDTVAQRREIALPAEALRQFVGPYELRPGFDMVFTVAANQLTVTPTGQPPDALFAESTDKFFSKRVDAQVEFVRDASGVVIHLVLHQGAFHGKAPRKP